MSKTVSTTAEGLCGASAPQGPFQESGQPSSPPYGGAEENRGFSVAPGRIHLHPWLKLVIGFALILLFIFGIGSASKFIPGARHMAQVIDERGLRATAIYYTDFEEPAEASEYIRDCLDYPDDGK